MTKKWIAINLILLLGAGLLGWQLSRSVRQFKVVNDPARIQPAKKMGALEGGLPAVQAPPRYAESEFAGIGTQNLFAESRKLEELVDTPAPVETRPLDIKPILTGVILSGARRMAVIVDPSSGNAAGRQKQTILVPGDTFRGFTVTDITATRMVLELGAQREVIPLFDFSKRKAQAGKTPIVATRIVSFDTGQTVGAGGAPTAVAAAPPASTRQGGAASPASPVRTNPPGNTVGQPGGRGNPQRGQPGPGQVQVPAGMQPQTWNQTIDSQGRVIINTPFGAFPAPNQNPPPQVIKK